MKRTLALSFLLAAIATASIHAVSVQDDPESIERARQQAAAAASQREMDARAQRNQKAAQDFIDRQRQQSESNIAAAENRMRESRTRENEVKFAALQKSARELVDLSIKTFNRLNASGAQSVSVTFLADLDKMEKLVKDLRKAAK